MFKDEYLHDSELAELLGISIKALRNKLSSGDLLPPRIQPPGCKARLWPKKDVYQWLDKYVVSSSIESQSIKRVARK